MNRKVQMLKRIALTAFATVAVGVASMGAASAATSPTVTYTQAGANAVSGYFAHATSGEDLFTHIDSYVGSSGNGSLANLPLSTTSAITGGAGLELCDRSTGEAAQVARIYVGNNVTDVVAATGTFGAALANGDRCENGVVNQTGVNGTAPTVKFDTQTVTTNFGYVGGSKTLTVASSNVVPANGTAVTLDLNKAYAAAHPSDTPAQVAIAVAAAVTAIEGAPSNIPATDVHVPTTGDTTVTLFVVNKGTNTFQVSGIKNGVAVAMPFTGTGNASVTWLKPTFTSVPGTDTTEHFSVLLSDIPVNDTVDIGLLSDSKSGFTFKGHNYAKGSVTATANDISQPTKSAVVNFALPNATAFDEADNGVVANTTGFFALPGTAPLPNGNGLTSSAPNELVRFAHVAMDANVVGSSEVHGALQSTSAWTAYPVAATSNGEPSGVLELAPSTFANDNMYVGGAATN